MASIERARETMTNMERASKITRESADIYDITREGTAVELHFFSGEGATRELNFFRGEGAIGEPPTFFLPREGATEKVSRLIPRKERWR